MDLRTQTAIAKAETLCRQICPDLAGWPIYVSDAGDLPAGCWHYGPGCRIGTTAAWLSEAVREFLGDDKSRRPGFATIIDFGSINKLFNSDPGNYEFVVCCLLAHELAHACAEDFWSEFSEPPTHRRQKPGYGHHMLSAAAKTEAEQAKAITPNADGRMALRCPGCYSHERPGQH